MKKAQRNIYLGGAFLAVVTILCVTEPAFARDLSSAASSAVSTAKNVARALSVFGIIVGGILTQLPGAYEYGKRTVMGGVVGAACSFGGPALITWIQNVFGTA